MMSVNRPFYDRITKMQNCEVPKQIARRCNKLCFFCEMEGRQPRFSGKQRGHWLLQSLRALRAGACTAGAPWWNGRRCNIPRNRRAPSSEFDLQIDAILPMSRCFCQHFHWGRKQHWTAGQLATIRTCASTCRHQRLWRLLGTHPLWLLLELDPCDCPPVYAPAWWLSSSP